MDAQHETAYASAARQLGQLAREVMVRFDHEVLAEVVVDVPARAIVERAASLHADCVVFGRHGHGRSSEPLLGSMAQQVLKHTLRDVLVVP